MPEPTCNKKTEILKPTNRNTDIPTNRRPYTDKPVNRNTNKPSTHSFSIRRNILPTLDLGKSSLNSTNFGTL